MSYKPWVRTNGDDWNTNALVFATKQEAEDYAEDLFYRWTRVEKYEARESDDPVNYVFTDGQLEFLSSEENE